MAPHCLIIANNSHSTLRDFSVLSSIVSFLHLLAHRVFITTYDVNAFTSILQTGHNKWFKMNCLGNIASKYQIWYINSGSLISESLLLSTKKKKNFPKLGLKILTLVYPACFSIHDHSPPKAILPSGATGVCVLLILFSTLLVVSLVIWVSLVGRPPFLPFYPFIAKPCCVDWSLAYIFLLNYRFLDIHDWVLT